MSSRSFGRLVLLTVALGFLAPAWARNNQAASFGVAPQYGTTHVYVAPAELDKFIASFIGTFGGQSTKQVQATLTPTQSKTSTQLLQTPLGTVSLFGFSTPIPYPFGAERYGLLVTDIDAAVKAARADGAELLVSIFPDPIGRDAIIQWPGGINMQLYWHTEKPSYTAFKSVPENRIYISPDRADAFIRDFVKFSLGKLVSDDAHAPGIEIGNTKETYRRVRIESAFGKLTVLVTNGLLPYPYGRELTGYEVQNLDGSLSKAKSTGADVLVEPYAADHRRGAVIQFPGGYIAEVHELSK
jgi:hypothetical protein